MIRVCSSAKAVSTAASHPGSARQSASMNANISPRASRIPRLRAGPGPGVGSETSRTSGQAEQTISGSLADPLSTTMISTLLVTPRWACRASSPILR
jgi:hypothetical protein